VAEDPQPGRSRRWPGWARFLIARPLIAVLIAAVAVGVIFLRGEKQSTPVTHREQRVALSDAEQTKLGVKEYDKTLQEERANIISSGKDYEQVQKVAARIAAVASRDKPNFHWRVTLIRDKQANAWCLPGGEIVVYTGILPYTKSDSGLATVLGHEVSHATAEHGAERIEREDMTKVAIGILAGGVAFTPSQYIKVVALLGAGAQVKVSLPFSRQQESEADHIGLVYMARAGYKPSKAISFWERMNARTGQKPTEFLSDHPSDARRIAQLRSWLPEAEREYRPA
jgi:metalloendopeptidase OMA1, mitochondrial